MDDDQNDGQAPLSELLAGIEQSDATENAHEAETDANAENQDQENEEGSTDDAAKSDDEGQDEGDQDDAEKPKRSRSGLQRIKARLQEAEAELAALRSRAPSADSADMARAVEAEIGAPPKESDFSDFLEFESARTAYNVEKRMVERELKKEFGKAEASSRERIQTIVDDAEDRLDELEKLVPGARAKVEASKAQPRPHVAQLVLESDKSALLQFHLSDKPEKLAELNRMSPVHAAREIGRLEARLSPPKPRTETKAPPPVRSPKGAAAPSSPEADLDAWLTKKYGKR